MVRAKLWFRCAAMHDPVTPMVVEPARIGWEAKRRQVGLTIERVFTGEELVHRMKGWVTVDPDKVTGIVRKYGRLKVLDERELVIDMETEANFKDLEKDLLENFGTEVDIEMTKKTA